MHYYRYVPGYYYHPGFMAGPTIRGQPLFITIGAGLLAPWFYGGYFAPAPYYPTASLWLTDYLLAENLKHAYEAGQESKPMPQPKAILRLPTGRASPIPGGWKRRRNSNEP